MCPVQLRAHVKHVGPEKLQTYEAIRAEIADWLAEESRKPTPAKHRAAALGPAADTWQEWTEAEDDAAWGSEAANISQEELETYDREQLLAHTEQLMALVKNGNSKKGRKGAGKGGKGGKG